MPVPPTPSPYTRRISAKANWRWPVGGWSITDGASTRWSTRTANPFRATRTGIWRSSYSMTVGPARISSPPLSDAIRIAAAASIGKATHPIVKLTVSWTSVFGATGYKVQWKWDDGDFDTGAQRIIGGGIPPARPFPGSSRERSTRSGSSPPRTGSKTARLQTRPRAHRRRPPRNCPRGATPSVSTCPHCSAPPAKLGPVGRPRTPRRWRRQR